MQKRPLKPFVKWVGGKGQLLPEIRRRYPAGLGIDIKRYAEPFVGGGAVLCDILSSYRFEAAYISDTNPELINAYLMIREEGEELIKLLSEYENEYLPLANAQRRKYYYAKRKRFNTLKRDGSASANVESAAIFIFLNKTCFNGLYRVNRRGFFNVPMGSYKKPIICDAENLMNISLSLQNVEIICGDYQKSSHFIDQNTFVYFDPPYRPLNATSNFTSYTREGFGDEEQRALAAYVDLLTRQGTKVIVSNSDPKNEDPEDNFFDELYSSHQISRVKASRMINRNAKGRGRISELLICNF